MKKVSSRIARIGACLSISLGLALSASLVSANLGNVNSAEAATWKPPTSCKAVTQKTVNDLYSGPVAIDYDVYGGKATNLYRYAQIQLYKKSGKSYTYSKTHCEITIKSVSLTIGGKKATLKKVGGESVLDKKTGAKATAQYQFTPKVSDIGKKYVATTKFTIKGSKTVLTSTDHGNYYYYSGSSDSNSKYIGTYNEYGNKSPYAPYYTDIVLAGSISTYASDYNKNKNIKLEGATTVTTGKTINGYDASEYDLSYSAKVGTKLSVNAPKSLFSNKGYDSNAHKYSDETSVKPNYTYIWLVGTPSKDKKSITFTPIAGANKSTFTPTKAQKGKWIEVVTVAKKKNYSYTSDNKYIQVK